MCGRDDPTTYDAPRVANPYRLREARAEADAADLPEPWWLAVFHERSFTHRDRFYVELWRGDVLERKWAGIYSVARLIPVVADVIARTLDAESVSIVTVDSQDWILDIAEIL